MSGIAGVEIRAAVKKAGSWNTAAACGANDGILILPSNIKKDASVDVDDSLGTYFSKDGLLGPIKVEGDISAYLRYDGLDVLMAMFMGIAGAPTQQGGTAAYSYTHKWATDTDGKFVTFCKNVKHSIEEFVTAKITGITIKGEVGAKALQVIFNISCSNKKMDSSVNTLVTFNNVTYFEQANRVKFSEGVFRMNDQSAAALADSNKIYPSSFELTAKRKLEGVYDGQYRHISGSNVQDLIDEPTNNGQPEIKLKLTFPRYTSATYFSTLGVDTRKKMDIVFTGANISASYNRQFKIEFPHLQMTNQDPADEQGIIKEAIEFVVHGAVTAPTGMTGLTDPFWISGINRRSTDPLA